MPGDVKKMVTASVSQQLEKPELQQFNATRALIAYSSKSATLSLFDECPSVRRAAAGRGNRGRPRLGIGVLQLLARASSPDKPAAESTHRPWNDAKSM